MTFAAVEKIADAVLFEGYMLYPYRPSALKNQQRWNFGTLWPRAFALAQRPQEPFSFHSEVLLEAQHAATFDLRLRFLQLVPRQEAEFGSWDIGVVRARTVEEIPISETASPVQLTLDINALSAEEKLNAPDYFEERVLTVSLEYSVKKLEDTLYRIAVKVANESPLAADPVVARREAQASAFTSAHLLMAARDGAFVSLLDPPAQYSAAAQACANRGVYPVLAAPEGNRHLMLCAPIILYDHPQIAPESPGDFFDSTEMDEMLVLRVLTLTETEKQEMRLSDPHARAILERVEQFADRGLLSVHGATHSVTPSAGESSMEKVDGAIEPWDPFAEQPAVESVPVFGVAVRKGDRVRLWPQKKADIMDMVMEGRVAVIEAIEQDLEGNAQFAVVLEDDPGRDLGLLRQAGHRFFFSPEEVEPLRMEAL
jgi:hypothetical protein